MQTDKNTKNNVKNKKIRQLMTATSKPLAIQKK